MNTTLVLEAAVRSLLMASVVWIGIRALRVSHVVARKIAWCLVLAASLAMPFLMRWPLFHAGPSFVLPAASLATQPVTASRSNAAPATQPAIIKHVPAVPQARPMTAPTHAAAKPTNAAPAATSEQLGVSPLQLALGVKPSTRHTTSWSGADSDLQLRSLVVPVYLLVASMLLLRLLLGVAFAIRIWYRAERASPILEPRGSVRISSQIDSPVTIASGIVLPESCEEWSRSKQRIVLAHERSHVRQGDFYIQLIAQLYTAIFWFSPLGWLLQKELSDLGEAISDRAALEEAASRPSYAELLLEFAALPRRPIIAVAMARSSNIQRRIDRLLTDSLFQRAFASARRHALLAGVLVPIAVVGATSILHVQAAESLKLKVPAIAAIQIAPPAPAAPRMVAPVAPAPAVAAPAAPVIAASSQSAPPPAAPEPAPEPALAPDTVPEMAPPPPGVAPAPSADMAPPPPPAQQEGTGFTYTVSDDDDENSYAIIDGDHSTLSGSWRFTGEVQKMRNQFHGPVILMDHDGKTYVIEDPALVSQAKALWAPMAELGHQQALLGEQQAKLGEQQARLGELQAKVSVPPADVQKALANLDARLKDLQIDKKIELNQEDLAGVQERLAEVQAKLGEMQGRAGDKESEFGEQQAKLGEQQAKLGEQQSKLGEQQSRLAEKAKHQMQSLLDQALKNGKAKPVQ